jgi:hypothetical protein
MAAKTPENYCIHLAVIRYGRIMSVSDMAGRLPLLTDTTAMAVHIAVAKRY